MAAYLIIQWSLGAVVCDFWLILVGRRNFNLRHLGEGECFGFALQS